MNAFGGHFLIDAPAAPAVSAGHGRDHGGEWVSQLSYCDARIAFDASLATASAAMHAGDGLVLVMIASSPALQSRIDLADLAERLSGEPRDALRRLSGAWMLVFADQRRGRCMIAADRAARRAPCFALSRDRLLFGLGAQDVVRRDRSLARLRAQSVFDYCYHHVIPAPYTIYEHVQRLGPAEMIELSGGAISRRSYWQPSYREDGRMPDIKVAKKELLELVESSVAEELPAGTAGAFLSGGTDSSTVAGMVTKITGEGARTYSIGFDAEGFDEMAYARIAARHFGLRHREYYATPQDLVTGIPLVARSYDQPFGNSSALPAFLCAQMAKADGVTRLLGGDGGDEIFGGNTRYAFQKVFDAYGRYTPAVADDIVGALLLRPDITKRLPVVRKARSYVEKAKLPLTARLQAYNLLGSIGIAQLFTAGFLESVDAGAPAREEAEHYASCRARSLVDRMLYFDWKYTLADNDLPKVVGTCDLAQMPVGFPFLDERLVEFANGLPPDWKVKRFRLRYFFKLALADFLPREILTKKKHGFGLPFGLWLVQHPGLQKVALDSMESLGERGLVRRDFLGRKLKAHLEEHPSYYGEIVWVMMMLEQWLQAHHPEFHISTQTVAA